MERPVTVFVVEDYTHVTAEDEGRSARPRLWNHVYLSLPRAKEGVEYWARKAGQQTTTWTELSHGVAAEDENGRGLFKVIPFGVIGDDDSEPEEELN